MGPDALNDDVNSIRKPVAGSVRKAIMKISGYRARLGCKAGCFAREFVQVRIDDQETIRILSLAGGPMHTGERRQRYIIRRRDRPEVRYVRDGGRGNEDRREGVVKPSGHR